MAIDDIGSLHSKIDFLECKVEHLRDTLDLALRASAMRGLGIPTDAAITAFKLSIGEQLRNEAASCLQTFWRHGYANRRRYSEPYMPSFATLADWRTVPSSSWKNIYRKFERSCLTRTSVANFVENESCVEVMPDLFNFSALSPPGNANASIPSIDDVKAAVVAAEAAEEAAEAVTIEQFNSLLLVSNQRMLASMIDERRGSPGSSFVTEASP